MTIREGAGNMNDFNPEPTSWFVTRIDEDAHGVKVTLQRTTWARPMSDDEDCDEFEDSEPGAPGSHWIPTGEFVTLPFERVDAQYFDINRHYVLGLTEVRDAAVMEA